MVDQSQNLKNKSEEMIQSAVSAQELYAKAAIVDHEKLAAFEAKSDLVSAEECLKDGLSTDVRPQIRAWRKSKGKHENPLEDRRDQQMDTRLACGSQTAFHSLADHQATKPCSMLVFAAF